MGTESVVFHAPAFEDDAGFGQAGEELPVETLV